MDTGPIILEVDGLQKKFGGVSAVTNLSLCIRAGKITGLIGPNGAGKTTFFNIVTGIYRPDSGRIIFSSTRIDRLKTYQIAQAGIARTFQSLNNFPRMTVFDNVRAGLIAQNLPLKEEEQKVFEIIELLEISDLAYKNVGDITPVARRLVEVGRALVGNPKLVLFDEIMAGFNDEEASKLIAILVKYARNEVSMCIIGHTMKAIMTISDEIIVMHQGTKFEQGSPSEIQSSKAVQNIYLGGHK
jgi:branched-chain amino acid transport system ATP-binding protein